VLFSIRFGDNAVVSQALVPMLAVLGFRRDCSCRWSCDASEQTLHEIITDLVPFLNGAGVWDAGKMFGTAGIWSSVTLPQAPHAWHGPVMIHVCESGHVVLFGDTATETEIRNACRDVYHRYLIREFHPTE
jgi:hypothetical protein